MCAKRFGKKRRERRHAEGVCLTVRSQTNRNVHNKLGEGLSAHTTRCTHGRALDAWAEPRCSRRDDSERDRLVFSGGDHLHDRGTFGTNGQAVGSILDVAPDKRSSRRSKNRRADGVAGIGSVGVVSDFASCFFESVPVDGWKKLMVVQAVPRVQVPPAPRDWPTSMIQPDNKARSRC